MLLQVHDIEPAAELAADFAEDADAFEAEADNAFRIEGAVVRSRANVVIPK